jgi:hypothetical protein
MNHLQKLNELLKHLNTAKETASKRTHYDLLDEWSHPVSNIVHQILRESGFKNGNQEYNKQYTGIQFWWRIYEIWGSICYSKYLETEVSRQHSSAYERNNAFIQELEALKEKAKQLKNTP